MKKIYNIILTIVLSIVTLTSVKAQSSNCQASVPNFFLDLTGNSDSIWISPLVSRVGRCCGVTNPDVCIRFIITLDSNAAGIEFDIASGAVPGGSMFYQIDCGPQVAAGSPICISGGTHELTFCKPGNNSNTYSIVSIPKPNINTIAVSDNCSDAIQADGLIASSVVINSIYPDSFGEYNSYLSCQSGCNNTIVNYQTGAPSYVDYQVCGDVILSSCFGSSTMCDTVRVFFIDNLSIAPIPDSIIFCSNETSTTVTGSFSGGLPPYTYYWTNGANGTGTIISNDTSLVATNSGTYSFVVRDSRFPHCSEQIKNVWIEKHLNPIITINPIDPQICIGTPIRTIVAGASSYSWIPSQGISETNNDTVYLSPNIQTTYTVIGTDTYGCTSTRQTTYTPINLPLVDAGNGDTICIGGSTQLNGSIGTTYLWSPSTGLNNPNIQNPIASPTSTTTYTLAITNPSGQIIVNGDFNGGNIGFSSDYTYNSNLTPEGRYYITSNPHNTHPNFSSCGDHTSGSGNMMVINGIGTPNTDVFCQTIPVAPNTNYAFSTWIQSVHPASPAIIQFSVNGALLGTPFTASSTTCVWQQFFSYWYSGNNENAVICIVNQNTTASGNDFALDDVNFSPSLRKHRFCYGRCI